MRDSWTIGPLTKLTYDERQTINTAIKEELNSYKREANRRYPDPDASIQTDTTLDEVEGSPAREKPLTSS